MKVWKKLTEGEIKKTVFDALENNVNYRKQSILGIPGSNLDGEVFNEDHFFLKDAPYLSTLAQNPNHIGCHTVGNSESFFKGTQKIESELIELCAVDILKAEVNSCDGYVASGGTEANIQAMWIYRNYFKEKYSCSANEIAVICNSDSHYSMDKGANLLGMEIYKVPVDLETRQISAAGVESTLNQAIVDGKKYFIIVCNMMTTMFGSVDDTTLYSDELTKWNLPFKLHVDGAFGGFYFPFSSSSEDMSFKNEHISSFTLDAHKMAQAPYGTGIFLIRKGFMKYANTQTASYVEGEDCTLIGSRSGANAVAIWMILMKNGPYGWFEKIFILQKRTAWMCEQLDEMDFEYYRHENSNIITINSKFIEPQIAKKYGLVPDNHNTPLWYKIVVMEHVSIEKLLYLLDDLRSIEQIAS